MMVGGAGALTAAWLFAGAALAQENFDQGKSGAQLYASDCAICHKSAQGLNKSGGLFGIESFLREHYTSSRESAAAIAAYLNTVGGGAAPAEHRPAKKKARSEKAKETKPDVKDGKPSETKPDGKSDEKPSEKKSDQKEGGKAAQLPPAMPRT